MFPASRRRSGRLIHWASRAAADIDAIGPDIRYVDFKLTEATATTIFVMPWALRHPGITALAPDSVRLHHYSLVLRSSMIVYLVAGLGGSGVVEVGSAEGVGC
ncbi:hypothetical protein, partial [Nocardia sp. NPDC004860]|uniref:hypothetical protein n=1 Tax=Nocardia sp. NPDC004860 TaxID=3154557 RepID=UPI0033AD09FA